MWMSSMGSMLSMTKPDLLKVMLVVRIWKWYLEWENFEKRLKKTWGTHLWLLSPAIHLSSSSLVFYFRVFSLNKELVYKWSYCQYFTFHDTFIRTFTKFIRYKKYFICLSCKYTHIPLPDAESDNYCTPGSPAAFLDWKRK